MGTRHHLRFLLTLGSLCVGCTLARNIPHPVARDAGTDVFTNLDAELDAAEDDAAREDAGGDAGTDARLDDGGVDVGTEDAGSGPRLDLFSAGAFSRTTEASYFTGAPTDGTTAFLAWSPPDVRRIEDRGDGLGPMLLLEGERTNILVQSREPGALGWVTGSGIFTPNAGPGPDGTPSADRTMAPANSYGPYQLLVTANPPYVGSLWARVAAGGGSTAQSSLPIEQGASWALPAGGIYARGDFRSAGTGGVWVPWDGRALYPGMVPQVVDYLADLHQVESGYFPSSAIRTGGSAVTRTADILSYGAVEYPPEMLSAGFQIVFAPDASSAELTASGLEMRLLSTSAGDYLRLVGTAGNCFVELACGAASVAAVAVTFSRGQALTITVEPGTGRLTVVGATTGGGTASGPGAPWPTGRLAVGSNGAGANSAFGRFDRYVVVP